MNQEIFYYLNDLALQHQWFDALVLFCANFLPFWIIFFLAVYFIFQVLKGKRSVGENFENFVILILSSFFVWGIGQLINKFYSSPRPFVALKNVNSIFTHGGDDSFPSGHTTFFFTLAFMAYYYTKRWVFILLLGGASIIAVSRIVAGVHWPADILGGIVLAFLGVWLVRKVLGRFGVI